MTVEEKAELKKERGGEIMDFQDMSDKLGLIIVVDSNTDEVRFFTSWHNTCEESEDHSKTIYVPNEDDR